MPPVLAAMVYGFLPAAVLGLFYGAMLRAGRRDSIVVQPVRRRRGAVVTAGTLLAGVLLAALAIAMLNGGLLTSGRPVDLSVAIAECGEAGLVPGLLAYCRGHPCQRGQCRWDVQQEALALYVEPPAGGGWSWAGGGLGTTRRADTIQHNIYWVQRAPNGFIEEGSPRRYINYRLRFDGERIEIGRRRFRFYPGMLLVIRFADDWSFTVGVGREGLQHTDVAIDHLQQALDRACAATRPCERPFRIHPGPIAVTN